jgi:hypothetical protein
VSSAASTVASAYGCCVQCLGCSKQWCKTVSRRVGKALVLGFRGTECIPAAAITFPSYPAGSILYHNFEKVCK